MFLVPPSKTVGSAGDLGQDVGLAQHEEVLAVDHDVCAAVLGVEDLVALRDVDGNTVAVVVDLALAHGENLAALRLLLGSVGQDDAARRRLLLLYRLDDQAIAQRLELHGPNLQNGAYVCCIGTLARRVPKVSRNPASGEGL